jgi:ureidoglycolate hydrolase
MLKIKTLTKNSFKKYGLVMELAPDKKRFHVLFGESGKTGWRVGYSRVRPEPVKMLELHPDSLETFEPVKGICVIVVAPEKKPEKMEAFLLDKPVCVNKKVWHEVCVISETCELKLVENYMIEGTRYHTLKKPIDVGMA